MSIHIRIIAWLALAAMAITAAPAGAATIEVDADAGAGVVEVADDGLCSIREAIDNANADSATHEDCQAGPGPDTIELPAGAVFTMTDAVISNSSEGNTGLPYIDSEITLEGNGATVQRDDNLACNLDFKRTNEEFRLLWIESGGDLTAQDLTLAHGCADAGSGPNPPFQGGAIFNNQGDLTLRRTTVRDNRALLGGALFGSVRRIEASTLANNAALLQGGALYLDGDTSMRNTTLSGNSAQVGGGIFVFAPSTGSTEAILEQVTFFHNNASNAGGGIYSQRGTTNAKNVILQDSSCAEGLVGTWNAASANLGSGTSCESLFGSNFNANVTTDLDSLADNGGPTETHALGIESDALDAAIDCTDFDSNPIDTDQRGVTRPQNSGCDIGAFELVQEPAVGLSKTVTDGDPYSAVGDEITYELVAENTGEVTLDNVAVSDPDATVSGCTPTAGSSLAPDDTMTCEATYTVTQDDVDAGSFTNTASVEGTGPDDSSVDDDDSAMATTIEIFQDRFEADG